MDKLKRKLRNIELGMKSGNNMPVLDGAAQGVLSGNSGYRFSQWMAERFNHNFDVYDSAIDAAYNQTHVGGSAYHHIIDGQHSVWGAFEAVKDVKIDDSWASELGQAMEHLIRDTASVSGINPFFTLSPQQFNDLGSFTANIGVSKEYLADALTINGAELLGGSIALLSSIIMGKKADSQHLSHLSGAYLISSLVSANPMLLPIAAGSMAYAVYKGTSKRELFIQAGKGAIVSGSALLVSSLIGGPVWLGIMAGFMAAVSAVKGLDRMENAFTNSYKLVKPAQKIMYKVSLNLS